MSKAAFFSLPVAIVAVLFLSACNEEPKPAPSDPSLAGNATAAGAPQTSAADMSLPLPNGLKGDPDKAAVFFMQNCATCHGTSGDGEGPRAYFINPPPRNFLLASSRQKLNRPVLFDAITNGRLGTEMPAWGKVLNEQEIADLAEFVFQTFILAPQDIKGQGSDGK